MTYFLVKVVLHKDIVYYYCVVDINCSFLCQLSYKTAQTIM